MWIIIEGPSLVGKSTLVKRLREELEKYGEVQLFHKDRPKEHNRRWVLRDYVLDHEGYSPRGEIWVSDRWHWGEVTYAPIYRPETNNDGYGLLGKAGWRWVELFLLSRGALIVALEADNESLARRLAGRGDDHVANVDELMQVSSLYKRARRDSANIGASLDTSGVEVDKEALDSLVETCVIEGSRRAAAVAQLVREFPEYVGSPRPDVLLVGDRRNVTKVHGEETRLTFMPVDGNSSEYLLGSLHDMGWRSVGMVNVNDMRGDVHNLRAQLGNPPVVALGNHAAEGMLAHGYAAGTFPILPHPQFVRRFHHSKQEDYGKAIIKAATTGEVSSIAWSQ